MHACRLVGCLECRLWCRWRGCKADLDLDEFNIRVIEPMTNGTYNRVYRCHEMNSNRVVAVQEVFFGDQGNEAVVINDRIHFLKDLPHQNIVRSLSLSLYIYC